MKKIFDRIEGYRGEIVTLQRELTSRVAIGPENGGTGEHEKAEFLRDRLQDLGPGLFEEIRAPEEKARDGYRPNLLYGKAIPTWSE